MLPAVSTPRHAPPHPLHVQLDSSASGATCRNHQDGQAGGRGSHQPRHPLPRLSPQSAAGCSTQALTLTGEHLFCVCELKCRHPPLITSTTAATWPPGALLSWHMTSACCQDWRQRQQTASCTRMRQRCDGRQGLCDINQCSQLSQLRASVPASKAMWCLLCVHPPPLPCRWASCPTSCCC